MLNASGYLATETLPNGLQLLIRATEPHDDLAGAVQRKSSPTSFFYRFLRRRRNRVAQELRFCQSSRPDRACPTSGLSPERGIGSPGKNEAEITFMVADDYQKQGIGTAMLNHLCSIARQTGLKRLYALAIPDNEGALRLLNKLGFPCDVRSDPAQRMMHITGAPTSHIAPKLRQASEGKRGYENIN
jgi:GNAT superfamily N-acetyltransferase